MYVAFGIRMNLRNVYKKFFMALIPILNLDNFNSNCRGGGLPSTLLLLSNQIGCNAFQCNGRFRWWKWMYFENVMNLQYWLWAQQITRFLFWILTWFIYNLTSLRWSSAERMIWRLLLAGFLNSKNGFINQFYSNKT